MLLQVQDCVLKSAANYKTRRTLFSIVVSFSGEGGDVSGDRDGAGARGETSRPRQRRTQHEPSPGGAAVSLAHTQTHASTCTITHLFSSCLLLLPPGVQRRPSCGSHPPTRPSSSSCGGDSSGSSSSLSSFSSSSSSWACSSTPSRQV